MATILDVTVDARPAYIAEVVKNYLTHTTHRVDIGDEGEAYWGGFQLASMGPDSPIFPDAQITGLHLEIQAIMFTRVKEKEFRADVHPVTMGYVKAIPQNASKTRVEVVDKYGGGGGVEQFFDRLADHILNETGTCGGELKKIWRGKVYRGGITPEEISRGPGAMPYSIITEYLAAIRKAILGQNAGMREEWSDLGQITKDEVGREVHEMMCLVKVWRPRFNPRVAIEVDLRPDGRYSIRQRQMVGFGFGSRLESKATEYALVQQELTTAIENELVEAKKRCLREQAQTYQSPTTQPPVPTNVPSKKRFLGLRIKYVVGIVVLGVLIAIVSWLQFPNWGISFLTGAILVFVALDKALSIIANWRKATE